MRSSVSGCFCSVLHHRNRRRFVNSSRRALLALAFSTRTKGDEEAAQEKGETKSSPYPKNFDFTALAASVSEIRERAVPSKISHAVQPDAHTLVLCARTVDDEVLMLHCSSHPTFARACLSNAKPPKVPKRERLSFGERATSLLRDKILTKAWIPVKYERLCMFSFAESARTRVLDGGLAGFLMSG